MIKHLILLTLMITLTACVQSGRYTIKQDKAPLRKPTTLEMQNPIPIYEDIYPWSLKPYTVRGKRYYPLQTAKNYHAQGIASWYGRKFHGHTTANGEIYNMFAMTAAHKTLPIPSYVKVTNLKNNKTVIVRVNDRGPFHGNRIIDLSYAAAYALDILSHGIAEVTVTAINIDKTQPKEKTQAVSNKSDPKAAITKTVITKAAITKAVTAPAKKPQIAQTIAKIPPLNVEPEPKPQRFVQVLASKNEQKLTALAKQLSTQYKQAHQIIFENGAYKLHLGPLQSEPQAQALIKALQNNGYPGAYMLYSKAQLPHN